MVDIIEYLFEVRGLKTNEERNNFLYPNFELHTYDPYLFSDMDKSVERLKKAFDEKEMIGIYTDYDCDGIPGAVVLSDFFTLCGHENFDVYIPDRQIDGYGLAQKGIDILLEKKCTLIITIDLGITGFEGADYLKQKNIDLIITDHHLPQIILPNAYAILNPKKEGDQYPFKDLCGTGVVFKYIQAFLKKYRKEFNIAEGQEKWLLDMVGLATLSDMVPLLGENRVFAYFGLLVLKKTKRPGLLGLYKQVKLKKETLKEDDITHSVTPKLNAASRMGDAYLSFKLLKTTNKKEAEILAKELESLNNKRKAHVAHIMKEIHTFHPSSFDGTVIVVGSPKWRPGVLGLVAAKLVDTYQKPVFVWGGNESEEEADILKGSCRASSAISVVSLMQYAKEAFLHYGGHTGAGGFAIFKKDIYDLKEKLEIAHSKVSLEENISMVEKSQSHFSVTAITDELFKYIDQFSPFGLANEKPVLHLEGVILESFKVFGKSGEHTELSLLYKEKIHKAIIFFKTPNQFVRTLHIGDTYTVFAHLEKSYFLKTELRLRLLDIY